MRALVIDMVLATDMSFHFDHLKAMRTLMSAPDALVTPLTPSPPHTLTPPPPLTLLQRSATGGSGALQDAVSTAACG